MESERHGARGLSDFKVSGLRDPQDGSSPVAS